MLTIALEISTLVTRVIGLNTIKQVMQAQLFLKGTTVNTWFVLIACILSTLLPSLLLILLFIPIFAVLLHIAFSLLSITVVCILLGTALINAVGVASGAFAIDKSSSGIRLSAISFLLANILIYGTLEIIVGKAVLATLDPSLQILIIHIIGAIFHLSISSHVVIYLFTLPVIMTLSTATSLLAFGLWKVQQELS